LKLLQESVDLAVRIKGADDGFHTPMVRRAYGSQLFQYGRVEQGLAFLELSLDASRRAQRSATRPFADSLARGGEAQTSLGRYRQASELIAEAEAIHARMKDSAESGQLTNVLLARAGLLVATGKPDEAEKILRGVPMALDGSSSFSYAWLDGSIAWADVKLAQGQAEPAIAYARAVRSRIESSELHPYLKRYEMQAALKEGKGLLLAGRCDEALPLLERAVTVGPEVYDSEHSLVLAESQIALGECAARLGNIDRARALLAQAKRIHSEYASIATRYTRPVNELETRLRLRQTTAVSHR
jgi:tetratricopeptide (TPR) repeat protein